MKWINHILIASSVTALWRPELAPVAAIGATAPDWLEWAGQRAGMRIQHRTATHVVASWVAGLAFGLWVWDWHHLIAAFSAAGLSHVLADSLTIMGVPWVWWSKQRRTLFGGRLRTGQPGEYVVAGLVLVACIMVSRATHGGDGEYSPFFPDYAGMYRRGVIDPKEWREHRFRFF